MQMYCCFSLLAYMVLCQVFFLITKISFILFLLINNLAITTVSFLKIIIQNFALNIVFLQYTSVNFKHL